MSVIIIDFFHWPDMGDWKLDPRFWPDPAAMVKELDEMGIKLMVSVWPTADTRSENYQHMEDEGLLVKNESGVSEIQRYMMRSVADEHAVAGGQTITVSVPLDVIPLFTREAGGLQLLPEPRQR